MRRTVFPVVNKKLTLLDLSRRVRSARWLSYVLLFLVAYTTTVEAVHTHRNLSRPGLAVETEIKVDADGPSQTRTQAPANECVACQFQRNLSNAELFSNELVLEPAISTPIPSISIVFVNSVSLATGHGRAPPVIS
jgi:hypothetical protein